jgi:hypothetical protein
MVVLVRTAPSEVWAERQAAQAAEQTPNMVVLGDPLPGRSALDAKNRVLARDNQDESARSILAC